MNVPNFLTGLRLAAVPVFVALFLSGRMAAALFVFVGAMVTDWLDGIAARMLKQFTAIGAILDPVADKLLGLSAVVLLCLTHRLPRWLLWRPAADRARAHRRPMHRRVLGTVPGDLHRPHAPSATGRLRRALAALSARRDLEGRGDAVANPRV